MKNPALIFALLILSACKPTTSQELSADSTAVDSASAATPAELTQQDDIAVSSSPASADREVLTKKGTVVYGDSIISDDASMGERATMEKVTVISTTGIRYPTEAELCNQFPMYQVRFAEDGTSGWVSGEDVLLIYADDNAYAGDLEYRGKSYQVYYAYDAGIGPSDSNGLTGCDSHKIPYLRNSETDVTYFITNGIPVSPSAMIQSFETWLDLISSEGGDASIIAIQSVGDEILFSLDISYQEGGERVIVHINQNEDGTFQAVSAEMISEESGD